MKPEPMQRVKLGSTNLAVAPIGLGTGGFGTRLKEPEVDRLVERYAALGGNLYDTPTFTLPGCPTGPARASANSARCCGAPACYATR